MYTINLISAATLYYSIIIALYFADISFLCTLFTNYYKILGFRIQE